MMRSFAGTLLYLNHELVGGTELKAVAFSKAPSVGVLRVGESRSYFREL